jgi:Ni/Co efflux regulator RcnB
MDMRHLKSLLLIAAVAGSISATITAAAPADSERSYLPPGAREKVETPAPARKAGKHRPVAGSRHVHSKSWRHAHAEARHRRHRNDFAPEEAILFLPRLFLGLFN